MDDPLYDLGEEQPTSTRARPGLPVEPRRVLLVVWSERQVLMRLFAATAAVALVASFFVPKEYKSGAQLLYEGTPVLDVGEKGTSPSAFVDSAMSSGHLGEVRERLGIDTSLNDMRGHLSVTLGGKNSMHITASAATAQEAQTLAQTVVDVFLARQASYNAKRLETFRAETARSLDAAIERRKRAAADFDAFRERSGKTHLLENQEVLLERVGSLQAQADAAAIEVAAQDARAKELEKARSELPRQVVASATVG
ncbi:MAG: hypothetical protein WBG86_16120, partial [Polyangiales bacterium]